MDVTVKKVFDYIIKNYEENVIVTRDFVEDVAKKMNLNLDDKVINKVLVQFGVNPMDESDESEKIWTSGMSKVGDYLKSNCRSWEQDCDNEQDTRELANHLTSKFPTLTSEEAWEVSKHWTGFEEEMNESEIPNPPSGINKAKPGIAEKYPGQFRPSCFKMPMNKKRIHERKIMDFAQFLKTINYRTHDGQSDGSTQRGHGQNLKP